MTSAIVTRPTEASPVMMLALGAEEGEQVKQALRGREVVKRTGRVVRFRSVQTCSILLIARSVCRRLVLFRCYRQTRCACGPTPADAPSCFRARESFPALPPLQDTLPRSIAEGCQCCLSTHNLTDGTTTFGGEVDLGQPDFGRDQITATFGGIVRTGVIADPELSSCQTSPG